MRVKLVGQEFDPMAAAGAVGNQAPGRARAAQGHLQILLDALVNRQLGHRPVRQPLQLARIRSIRVYREGAMEVGVLLWPGF